MKSVPLAAHGPQRVAVFCPQTTQSPRADGELDFDIGESEGKKGERKGEFSGRGIRRTPRRPRTF